MAGDIFIFTGANDDSYDVSLSFNYMQRYAIYAKERNAYLSSSEAKARCY
ncbi:hypothetical protein HanIR_Chr12g0606721 [Helianthus annuus]|nr:hypothetical protein HanIR_Chr12g0606721 [Helianthus annuus]